MLPGKIIYEGKAKSIIETKDPINRDTALQRRCYSIYKKNMRLLKVRDNQ